MGQIAGVPLTIFEESGEDWEGPAAREELWGKNAEAGRSSYFFGTTFSHFLASKAATFLVWLSKARQRKWIGLLFQLAGNPFQFGDSSESNESGREAQFILVQDLLTAFWADHAVRELRIVDIEKV